MVEKSIGRLISILNRHAHMFFNEALKDLDIPSSEQLFLIVLFKEGNMTQEALCTRLRIDKAATARALKSLEQKGYIKREISTNDRRAKTVSTTDKAEAIKDRLLESRHKWTEILQGDLDPELAHLMYATLEQMVKKVEGLNRTEQS